MARPKKIEPKQPRIPVDLGPELKRELEIQAERHGMSQQKIIKRATELYLEKLKNTEPL